MEYEFYDKYGNLISLENFLMKDSEEEHWEKWERLQKMYKIGELEKSGKIANKMKIFKGE